MNKSDSAVKHALLYFFRTTTLHGFKYLCSAFYIDRVVWVASCCASACCAGVLCAVLWARFLQMPALLELRDMRANGTLPQYMPRVAVCAPMHTLAQRFVAKLTMNASAIGQLTRTIEIVLSGKSAAVDQVKVLEQLLSSQDMTLTEMMLKYSPPCEELMVTCRWQRVVVPCTTLFDKELTGAGACCVMRPDKAYYRLLSEPVRPTARFGQIRMLDLSLQCSNETIHGCKLFVKYDAERNVEAILLAPGYIYIAQMLFISVPMSSTEDFLESECIADKSYARETCLDKCAERYCGCSDPLRDIETDEEHLLPPCSITQLGCLRAYGEIVNVSCDCLPPCNTITSDVTMEWNSMNLDKFTVDPIYNGLNNKSSVIHMRLDIPSSKIFTLNPTETWLTLLSSLGGVFNMFLGVGLFSALEIVYLLIVRLPIALLKSP